MASGLFVAGCRSAAPARVEPTATVGENETASQPVVAAPKPVAKPARPEATPRAAPYTNRALAPDKLIIPSIELDAKVIPIGTTYDKNGKLAWETAAFAVGHHRSLGMPGQPGNVVLSGHISSPSEGAVFNKLPKVKLDDGVVVVTSDKQFLYRVTETNVVPPSAVEFLDQTEQSVLTMITCVPDGVYSHRLIVRAEAV